MKEPSPAPEGGQDKPSRCAKSLSRVLNSTSSCLQDSKTRPGITTKRPRSTRCSRTARSYG